MSRFLLPLLLFLSSTHLFSEPLMRISVENTPTHVQTRAVQRFAEKLQTRLEGRLKVEFYPGAALFRDQDVLGGMARGRVEMAVPGTWQIDKRIPGVGLFLLPEFFGQDGELNYRIMDSPLGEKIVESIENGLGVKVLGGWIDLGPAQLFSCGEPLTGYGDMAGKTVRVAGGLGNERRIAYLGGDPVVIAFPDLPYHLEQGKVQGVLTTYETVRSASLWDYGITSVFEDNEYFAQYVPMVAEEFWNRLPGDIRGIIIETWQEGVAEARAEARYAQGEAKNAFVEAGGQVVLPGRDYLSERREALMERSGDIAAAIGIPPEMREGLRQYADPRGEDR